EYAIIAAAVLVVAGLLVFVPKLKGSKFEEIIGVARVVVEAVEQDFKFVRKENETPEEADKRRKEMHAAGIAQLKEALTELGVKLPNDTVLDMALKAAVSLMNTAKNLTAKDS